MAMKPILFSTSMVRAILDNRKTETRRLVKPQPFNIIKKPTPSGSNWLAWYSDAVCHNLWPRYQPGDILYVRETWADNIPGCPPNGISYRADHENPEGDGPANPIKWRPSIHMPKKIARIFLMVTDSRFERLQEITEEDAIAEGCGQECGCSRYACENCMDTGWIYPPMQAFEKLWDSLNTEKEYLFRNNPWVEVDRFKQISMEKIQSYE